MKLELVVEVRLSPEQMALLTTAIEKGMIPKSIIKRAKKKP